MTVLARPLRLNHGKRCDWADSRNRESRQNPPLSLLRSGGFFYAREAALDSGFSSDSGMRILYL